MNQSCVEFYQPRCNSSQIKHDCQLYPPAVCMHLSTLHEHVDIKPNNDKSGLIAGLTTCVVVLFLIVFTFSGFVCYKRRQQKHKEDCEKLVMIDQPWPQKTPIQPDASFIIGAQSLQIPHLDSPDPILIRRSLHIQPTITSMKDIVNRSSSVKVTKYDHKMIPTLDDDDELRRNKPKRAVSVKKGDSNMMRVVSLKVAKPKMVLINTVTSKEGGVTRKRSFRTVIEPTIHVANTKNHSTSSLGDGEITIYLKPSP